MSVAHSWWSIDPEAPPGRGWQYAHGEHCTCLLLAAAVGAGPEAVSCDYCRNVLQKHWEVSCHHGECVPQQASANARRHALGKLDPVKAMLLKEA